MNFYGNYVLHEERLRDLEQQAKRHGNRRIKLMHHKLMHHTGRLLVHVGQTMQDLATR